MGKTAHVYFMTMISPWPGRGWPLGAEEEKLFMVELRKRASGTKTNSNISRDAVTLLVTALRTGSSVDDVLTVAPQIDVGALVKAHRYLQRRMRTSANAWRAICENPEETVKKNSLENMSLLLPQTANRLKGTLTTKDAFKNVVVNEERLINEIRQRYNTIWATLAQMSSPEKTSFFLRSELYHPDRECLLTNRHFLPQCVAELAPLSVASLLGEHHLTARQEVVQPPARTRQG